MVHIIDGKQIAQNLKQKLVSEVAIFNDKLNRVPGLAVIIVGDDAASHVYVSSKEKQTKELGMHSLKFVLPESISEAELLAKIDELNNDNKIDGILVQLPLPDHISENKIIEAISPLKDVDGFHPINVGNLSLNKDGLIPCTPLGSLILIKSVLSDLSGLNAVVVGRSNIVGKPMAQLLLRENATVTVAHSRTKNLQAVTQAADILIAAVGRPEFIKADMIKSGAIVIDVGINRVDLKGDELINAQQNNKRTYKLVGDVDYKNALSVASAITPVPGGVGPMTIACLLHNTIKAACLREGLPFSDKI